MTSLHVAAARHPAALSSSGQSRMLATPLALSLPWSWVQATNIRARDAGRDIIESLSSLLHNTREASFIHMLPRLTCQVRLLQMMSGFESRDKQEKGPQEGQRQREKRRGAGQGERIKHGAHHGPHSC